MSRSLADVAGLVRRHAIWMVRDRFPHRKVTREVHGVRMVLPWSHRLPDYSGPGSVYGQNLVELAAALGGGEAPLTVLDVGANVGDSALQVLHAVDARILCVEGDPDYLEFLHLNTDADPRVSIVEALLATDDRGGSLSAVRGGGTTRFEASAGGDGFTTVTVDRLRAEHPDFQRLRLAKSDTDGYDVALVPLIAEAWREQPPVLFFEYDHQLSRLAGHDPLAVWDKLATLGYLDVAVWDGGGRALGRTTIDAAPAQAGSLEGRGGGRARKYWDVAVAHADDAQGREVLRQLVPGSLAL
ncbi:FkbM family methyltransferase [Nocardioides terrisoli]|uniref:FkbM family methyltransferase n=1 Tax=Nocardioides terrisoli TaxID=3388267 RepID=UPI00287B97D8|nr:FkbM family methyltransferase [Nocardioides marmorisolisilvae]